MASISLTTPGGYTTEANKDTYDALLAEMTAKNNARPANQKLSQSSLEAYVAYQLRNAGQNAAALKASQDYLDAKSDARHSSFAKKLAIGTALAFAGVGALGLASGAAAAPAASAGGSFSLPGTGVSAGLKGASIGSAASSSSTIASQLGGLAGEALAGGGTGAFSSIPATVGRSIGAKLAGNATLSGALSGLKGANDVLGVFNAVGEAQKLFKGGQSATAPTAAAPVEAAQAPAFTPTRPDALRQPESLGAEFSGFSPEQQRSALATKGLNGGLGSEEDAYYRNLIQRSLIGDNNQVAAGNSDQFLLPIESQYFSRKGFNTSDPMQFLQGISG